MWRITTKGFTLADVLVLAAMNLEDARINTLSNRLAEYIRKHYLPASVNPDGSIATINEFLDRDGVSHSESINVKPTTSSVREFLGY